MKEVICVKEMCAKATKLHFKSLEGKHSSISNGLVGSLAEIQSLTPDLQPVVFIFNSLKGIIDAFGRKNQVLVGSITIFKPFREISIL